MSFGLLDHLRRVPLFQDLSGEQLQQIADLCEEQRVAAGTVLTRQGELGSTLFLIERGGAVVHRVDEQGAQRPVGTLGPGRAFGVTSLLLGEPRDATISAAEEMRFWTLQSDDFYALLQQHPEIERRLVVPGEIQAKLRAPQYAWLEPGEYVVFFSRRHWTWLLRALLKPTLLVSALAGLLYALSLVAELAVSPLVWLGGLVFYALAVVWVWFDWRNDLFIVSTRRISHHERVYLVYEASNEAPLDRVQNVKIRRAFWGSLLGYGDLTIETAAQVGSILFDHIPQPERMREAVFAQLARVQAAHHATQRQVIRRELAGRVGEAQAEPEVYLDAAAPEAVTVAASADATGGFPGRVARAIARAVEWLSQHGVLPQSRLRRGDAIIWRKHWLFLLGNTALPFLATAAGLGLTIAGFLGQPQAMVSALSGWPWVALVLTLVAGGWLWWQWNDWCNDQYIVGSERIVDLEKRPLFFEERRREASLGRIQNVSLEMPHVLAAILNYGDVIVQTAGAGPFTFHQVPRPREVQAEIFRRLEAFRETQRRTEAGRRRAELAEWFTVYEELRRGESPEDAPPTPAETPPPASS